jgi:hypothetical protein
MLATGLEASFDEQVSCHATTRAAVQFYSKLKHSLQKTKQRSEDTLNNRISKIIRAAMFK